MNYYFVDFENIKADGLKNLQTISKGDYLIIFYTDNCRNITIDIMENIFQKKIQFQSFKVKVGTKNALDFQLSSYLGYVIGKNKDIASKYFIISNDKGFDCLCNYWAEQNILIERKSLQNEKGKVIESNS